MKFVIVTIMILVFISVMYIFEIGYPKHALFKKLLHDKCKIHIPDLNNQLDYDKDKRIVYSKCKYCNKEILYIGICEYLVSHNPEKIPDSIMDPACRECISKKYTLHKSCCPYDCNDDGICDYCKKHNFK